MTLTYNTDVKNTRMDAVDDAINNGGGISGPPAPGKLEIGTTGMATILATITLDEPAFGDSVAGVITLAGFPKTDSSADNTGVAAEARIRDSADTDVVSGLTVGLGGTDVIVSDVDISEFQAVTINSGTLTHGQA